MNQEPSVLDFLKARIRYGFQKILHPSASLLKPEQPEELLKIEVEEPPARSEEEIVEHAVPAVPAVSGAGFFTGLFIHWRTMLAFALGLFAQLSLQPRQGVDRHWQTGLILYGISGLVLVWANLKHEWSLQAWEASADEPSEDKTFLRSSAAFIASLVFSLIAFSAFGGGLFTWFNL